MSFNSFLRFVIPICGLAFAGGCQRNGEVDSSRAVPPGTVQSDASPTDAGGSGLVAVVMDTSMGTIELELDPGRTPATVKNFLRYVDEKFYDNTIFHRVISGFMIQGGGFGADLQEKPTHDPVKNESSKGPSNRRGTIAMARTNDPNSATAQFFINHVDNSRLDSAGGGYCAFGRVTAGMDVVDRIASVNKKNLGGAFTDMPAEQVVIRSIRRK